MKHEESLMSGNSIAEVPARVLAGQLNLDAVWTRVHDKHGMPGADGVSVGRFGRQARANLAALQSRLAGDRYQPLPLRMAEVEKKSGSTRLLLIPCVTDRVVQSAVAQWLGARWNPAFDPNSFAYRPGVGVASALRALASFRERGFHWVLDADIRSFFDSIDQNLLLEKLKRWLGAASPLVHWIEQWLAGPVWDGAALGLVRRGVPQGSPLSPLLSNYYLDDFDRRLRAAGIQFVRYADDFLVLARTPFDLAEARQKVEESLRDLNLILSEEKTQTTTFEQWFRFLGAEIQGDSILLPFDKNKKSKSQVYVAPVMPPALLRAYRTGHLKATRPFEWKERRLETAAAPPSSAPSTRDKALHRLSGVGETSALDALRRRIP
jgi:group II intron reverse transcriptase/maturase